MYHSVEFADKASNEMIPILPASKNSTNDMHPDCWTNKGVYFIWQKRKEATKGIVQSSRYLL